MRTHPKILMVESGSLALLDTEDGSMTPLLDVQRRTPAWWRKIEARLRLDISLALHARLAESQCDLVWAGSEAVGIPLSFVLLRKPLIVIAHHMSSPKKAGFARRLGVVKRWAGIGFISDESKDFFINYFGVHPDQLFQYMSAKYLDKADLADISFDGPIMSTGVAKRDYNTLIAALAGLPGYETELFMSSRYGDQLKSQVGAEMPQWVKVMGWVSEEELILRYQRTRFVVVPLDDTTHSGAGITAVLEAGAFGKAVIATKTGGMPTFVREGETGLLVPPNDVQAMRSAIQKLCNEPELARHMGQAGRRYMETRFNPKIVNARISALQDELFARQRRPQA